VMNPKRVALLVVTVVTFPVFPLALFLYAKQLGWQLGWENGRDAMQFCVTLAISEVSSFGDEEPRPAHPMLKLIPDDRNDRFFKLSALEQVEYLVKNGCKE